MKKEPCTDRELVFYTEGIRYGGELALVMTGASPSDRLAAINDLVEKSPERLCQALDQLVKGNVS